MTSKSRKPDVADGSPADETTRELEQIENRFLTALARGEAPSVAEIVAAHPDLASQLRQRLDDARALHELHNMQ